jgi:hypothetical protein
MAFGLLWEKMTPRKAGAAWTVLLVKLNTCLSGAVSENA